MGAAEAKALPQIETETRNIDEKIVERLSTCYRVNVKTLSVLLALLADEEARFGRDKSTIWIMYRTFIGSAHATDKVSFRY